MTGKPNYCFLLRSSEAGPYCTRRIDTYRSVVPPTLARTHTFVHLYLLRTAAASELAALAFVRGVFLPSSSKGFGTNCRLCVSAPKRCVCVEGGEVLPDVLHCFLWLPSRGQPFANLGTLQKLHTCGSPHKANFGPQSRLFCLPGLGVSTYIRPTIVSVGSGYMRPLPSLSTVPFLEIFFYSRIDEVCPRELQPGPLTIRHVLWRNLRLERAVSVREARCLY